MPKRTSQFKAFNIATNSTLLFVLNLLLLNLLAFNVAPVFAADNPPRKIVSGWIPYY